MQYEYVLKDLTSRKIDTNRDLRLYVCADYHGMEVAYKHSEKFYYLWSTGIGDDDITRTSREKIVSNMLNYPKDEMIITEFGKDLLKMIPRRNEI